MERNIILLKTNILFCLLTSLSTTAQIVPDKTLPVNSNVTNQGNISVINGGTPAGNNLFHSFEKFSIPTGSTAHFNNSIDIQNIISRVTSESISNIDGLIRANGTANLFLLNPNGIIFGPNASLNIGGSFLASTASSMDFADGTQFSAKTPQTKPLLIVSVPIGLQFGSNPGGIHLQGTGHKLINPDVYPVIRNTTSTGLHVQPGKTLALVGGDVTLNGGTLMAEGGRIELGSVGGDGLVSISPTTSGWTLSYQGTQNFQNIHLSHQSLADASGVGGSIQVQGRNVKLTDSSVILIQNQGLLPSGTLSLNASEHLEISGINPVTTIIGGLRTETQSIFGNGGDIVISAPRLFVQDGNRITTRTYGISKAGNIIVNAPNSVQLSGASPIDPRALSNIASLTLGFGKAGDITVSTGQFVVTGGASVSSVTYGIGSGGNVILNTTGSVEVIGFEPRILAPSNLAATTLYDGKAGTLEIYTSNLRVWDGGRITSSTFAKGNAGSVTIYAKESVEVSGTVPGSVNSSLVDSSAQVVDKTLQQVAGLPPVPSGNSGDVTINTERLSVTNGGQISVRNDGPGNAGILEINANSINLDEQGSVTALTRGVNSKGGNIDIGLRFDF